MPGNKKIGIFGGSFDPIHFGHLKVAEAVLKANFVDEVWFIPSVVPPHKDSCMFSIIDRLKFIELSIIGNPRFKVLNIDFNENEKSFTYLLLNKLSLQYPDNKFYFIIGADNVTKLQTWYNYEGLFTLTDFIVLDRKIENKSEWQSLPYFSKLIFLEMPICDISSSMIRNKIINKETIDNLLPQAIINLLT